MRSFRLLLLAVALAAPRALAAQGAVDWPSFLARHDLVWSHEPARWGESAFIGNGNLGATVFAQDGVLGWTINRTDVTHDQSRYPIGRVTLHTKGAQRRGTARLTLWDAEASGDVVTDSGVVHWRSFTSRTPSAIVIELAGTGAERSAELGWEPAEARPPRKVARKDPFGPEDLHPAPTVSRSAEGITSIQPFHWRRSARRVHSPRRGRRGASRLLRRHRQRGDGRRGAGRCARLGGFGGLARRAPADVEPSCVVARLLSGELRVLSRSAPGGLLLDPDVQARVRDARRRADSGSQRTVVQRDAVAGDLVEPQHPAHLLAAVPRQSDRFERVAVPQSRPQHAGAHRQRAAAAARRSSRDRSQLGARPRAQGGSRDRDQRRRARDGRSALDALLLLAVLSLRHERRAAPLARLPTARPRSGQLPGVSREGFRGSLSSSQDALAGADHRSRREFRSRPAALGAADDDRVGGAAAHRRSAPAALARSAGAPHPVPRRRQRIARWTRSAVEGVAPPLLASACDLSARPHHSRQCRGPRAHRAVAGHVGRSAGAVPRLLLHWWGIDACDARPGRRGARADEQVPRRAAVHGAEHLLRGGGAGDRDAVGGGEHDAGVFPAGLGWDAPGISGDARVVEGGGIRQAARRRGVSGERRPQERSNGLGARRKLGRSAGPTDGTRLDDGGAARRKQPRRANPVVAQMA
jgi:hypothetical protein